MNRDKINMLCSLGVWIRQNLIIMLEQLEPSSNPTSQTHPLVAHQTFGEFHNLTMAEVIQEVEAAIIQEVHQLISNRGCSSKVKHLKKPSNVLLTSAEHQLLQHLSINQISSRPQIIRFPIPLQCRSKVITLGNNSNKIQVQSHK